MQEQNQIDKNKSLVETNNESSQVLNGLGPMSFFKKDKSFVFAHQKIEKLVSAVYLITNFLPSEEPIKWSLRNLCMRMLHLNIDLKNGNSVNHIEKEKELKEIALEIISLLEVGMFAGLVSSMNLSILKREFHSLLEHVEKAIGRQNLHKTFADSSVFVDGEEVNNSNFYSDNGLSSRGISSSRNFRTSSSRHGTNSLVKDKKTTGNDDFYGSENRNEYLPRDSSSKAPKLKEFGPVAVKKNKRQSIIIGLLKKKKEIMVKDVSEIISDCSEKTIQRELLSLVSQGILGKVGERRWTHYFLATPQ